MLNFKLIASILIAVATMLLIYFGHDDKKNPLLWKLAVLTSAVSMMMLIHSRYEEHKHEVRTKETISPLIRSIISFNANCYSMMAVGARLPSENLDGTSEKTLQKILLKLNPHSNSPMVAVPEKVRLNWLGFLLQMCEQTNLQIKNIFAHSSKIDSELIKILSKIENSYLLKDMQLQISQGVGNSDLTYELKFILAYFNFLNELNDYYTSKLKQFDDNSLQNAMMPYMG